MISFSKNAQNRSRKHRQQAKHYVSIYFDKLTVENRWKPNARVLPEFERQELVGAALYGIDELPDVVERLAVELVHAQVGQTLVAKGELGHDDLAQHDHLFFEQHSTYKP